jgi:hypothetical protein
MLTRTFLDEKQKQSSSLRSSGSLFLRSAPLSRFVLASSSLQTVPLEADHPSEKECISCPVSVPNASVNNNEYSNSAMNITALPNPYTLLTDLDSLFKNYSPR